MVQLEAVGQEEDDFYMVEKEKDLKMLKAVKSIHKNLNYKSREQMEYAFRNAGKLDKDTRKLIKIVTAECKTYNKVRRSRPRPSVAIPRAGDFNTVVSLDLKSIKEKLILCMVCTCTRCCDR